MSRGDGGACLCPASPRRCGSRTSAAGPAAAAHGGDGGLPLPQHGGAAHGGDEGLPLPQLGGDGGLPLPRIRGLCLVLTVKIGKGEGITEAMPVSKVDAGSRNRRTGHGRRTKPKAAPKKVLLLVFLVVGDYYSCCLKNEYDFEVFFFKKNEYNFDNRVHGRAGRRKGKKVLIWSRVLEQSGRMENLTLF